MSVIPSSAKSTRRPFTYFEIPRSLRALVRARESGLIVLAAAIGALAGLVVALMSVAVTVLHAMFFQVPPGQRLSALPALDPYVAVLVPTFGVVIRKSSNCGGGN